MGIKITLYRWFHRVFIRHIANSRRFGSSGLQTEEFKGPLIRSRERAWFHAASVGELESLWPVIQRWISSGREAWVTIFSKSALGSFKKLSQEMRALPEGESLFLGGGFSPWEGEWERQLALIRPQCFVTAKYEAWPELWFGLSRLGLPLFLVGAKARNSLKIASRITRWLGGQLPQIIFLTAIDRDRDSLQGWFPSSRVHVTGDPRWDRVVSRKQLGSPRAREILTTFGNMPKPWGIFGSAWKSDLKFWGQHLKGIPGSLWIVPHQVEAKAVDEIESALNAIGIQATRTRGGERASPCPCIIVNELGVLSEIYSAMDWAYVGGGFEAGVHSTIEPAVSGLPIACGPYRAARFSEIPELSEAGQLVVLKNEQELVQWTKAVLKIPSTDRNRWADEAKKRLGATERVFSQIVSQLSP